MKLLKQGSIDKFKQDIRDSKQDYNEHMGGIHEKSQAESIIFDAEFIKVVKIPIMFTKDAWIKVNELVSSGYTIKAVLEREYTHTSLVILEKTK